MNHNKDKTLESLKKSLSDPRTIGVTHDLERVMFRQDQYGNITHRMKDSTGKEITSIDDIIALITDECELHKVKVVENRFVNNAAGIKVRMNHVKVTLHKSLSEDNNLRMEYEFGEYYVLAFVLAYLNDNDTEIPLKPVYISLDADLTGDKR